MSILKEITVVNEKKLLIVFADLSGFSEAFAKCSSIETFAYMTDIYEITGEAVEAAGGVVIKLMGDESLSVFPESNIDEAIMSLIQLKERIDEYNASSGIESALIVRCHMGTVAIGLTGCSSDKRLDIMGNEVNRCAMLKSDGFTVSSETYSMMSSEVKEYFVKDPAPPSYSLSGN
jgi:adenylate cyclase